MKLIFKKKRTLKVRVEEKLFLLFPIFHRGKLHWLYNVRLEKAFNGYKMKIIRVEPIIR
ncbi:hypothetical protein [Tenacibaculum halocynthiae]|uniref:hypothetical protein n=1 Tax=Tenacibaculum halocynthiae TaxID=1254437 RepID=UPI003D6523EC